jgi:hypothetical protein
MATATIQAIETNWNGYRCRSRLEARWLLFLHTMQIDFQYEPEGYKLPDGTWYLPDLLLPHVRLWAEIKPVEFTSEEKDKCKRLVDETGWPCLLLVGPPDFKTYTGIHSTDKEEGTEIAGVRFETDYLLDIHYHNRKIYDRQNRLYSCTGGEFKQPEDFTEHYRFAVHRARSERFSGAAA